MTAAAVRTPASHGMNRSGSLSDSTSTPTTIRSTPRWSDDRRISQRPPRIASIGTHHRLPPLLEDGNLARSSGASVVPRASGTGATRLIRFCRCWSAVIKRACGTDASILVPERISKSIRSCDALADSSIEMSHSRAVPPRLQVSTRAPSGWNCSASDNAATLRGDLLPPSNYHRLPLSTIKIAKIPQKALQQMTMIDIGGWCSKMRSSLPLR